MQNTKAFEKQIIFRTIVWGIILGIICFLTATYKYPNRSVYDYIFSNAMGGLSYGAVINILFEYYGMPFIHKNIVAKKNFPKTKLFGKPIAYRIFFWWIILIIFGHFTYRYMFPEANRINMIVVLIVCGLVCSTSLNILIDYCAMKFIFRSKK